MEKEEVSRVNLVILTHVISLMLVPFTERGNTGISAWEKRAGRNITCLILNMFSVR